MHFEEIKKDTLYIALEISNSNKEYNLLENGVEYRTLHQLENEFLTSNTESLFVKLDDT